jgi:hypothetical protein
MDSIIFSFFRQDQSAKLKADLQLDLQDFFGSDHFPATGQ